MFLGKGPQFNAAKLEGIKVVIIFADGYTDEWPGLALGPSWMQPHQEQALEDFVAAGGSFMPLHNSMWGYPIGSHPTRDEITLKAMAAELTEVSGKLRASTKPTTTEEVGLGDEAKMGPYRRVCGGPCTHVALPLHRRSVASTFRHASAGCRSYSRAACVCCGDAQG